MNIEQKRRKTRIMLLCMIFSAAAIWIGGRYASRQYYAISLLTAAFSAVPFFFMFENRKPQGRECMTLAVMTVIAVLSRAMFAWAGHFKPMLGIVIITAVAFGPEAGYLTGALSIFFSNFVFGQGPWTPWQMLAFGLAGVLAGVLYREKVLPERPLVLAGFGFFMTVLIVGPLLDICSLLLSVNKMTGETVFQIFRSGFPVNLTHGAAVGITLLLLSRYMLEKLRRLKEKYGMMED